MSDSRDPVDCNPPGSSIHGIFQARILEWVAVSFSRDLLNPAIIARSPESQTDVSPFEPLKNYKSQVSLLPASKLVEATGSSGRRLGDGRKGKPWCFSCFLRYLLWPQDLFCGSGSFQIVFHPVVHIPPGSPHFGAPATSPSSGGLTRPIVPPGW